MKYASLSLDLDNKWSYMKTRGDARWESLPSYFDLVVPRVLELLERRGLTITFFIVGQDAVIAENHASIGSIAQAGHEIGNHSFHHEPWLHLYSREQICEEFDRTEAALWEVTHQRPLGFRGPGYSFSDDVLRELTARGYAYDASTFPTFVGPAARFYYFLKTGLSRADKRDRKQLFGNLRDGFRSLKAYQWTHLGESPYGPLLEIPVTTFPVIKSPIHLSYLIYLSRWSESLAIAYLRSALTACRLTGVAPSFLLHPLDFIGGDEELDLAFFPGMDLPAKTKLGFVERVFDSLQRRFECVSMATHASRILGCPIERQPGEPRPTPPPSNAPASRAKALA